MPSTKTKSAGSKQNPPVNRRLASIDVFRALTMLLMLWVNDFWTLVDIPEWLQHAAADENRMGFSDTIFPAFLFVVGLSIPFAIENRSHKGDSTLSILMHIGERTFALLLMGVFMVNLENIAPDSIFIGRDTWQILMTLSFFLIWNAYPNTSSWKRPSITLKACGYAILIILAILYRGAGEPETWMKAHWWGILGLIGWCYLLASVVYFFTRQRVAIIAIAWLALALMNIADFAGFLDPFANLREHVWIVSSGSLPSLTMAGVFASALYLRFSKRQKANTYLYALISLGVGLVVLGLLLRPYWGISKILATPAWTHLCAGLSLLTFAGLYWLVDLRGKSDWARPIEPAGTATLTCYLLPYWVYGCVALTGLSLPIAMRTGMAGLGKSLVFAFLIVGLTAVLKRARIRLRI